MPEQMLAKFLPAGWGAGQSLNKMLPARRGKREKHPCLIEAQPTVEERLAENAS